MEISHVRAVFDLLYFPVFPVCILDGERMLLVDLRAPLL